MKAYLRIWYQTYSLPISSVQLLSCIRLFATPWIAARQASLSITNSQSSLKLTSIELVMPSSHLILYYPHLFLPPIPPSIRVFSNESTRRMRWPKYWSFSFSIIPSKEHPGPISFIYLFIFFPQPMLLYCQNIYVHRCRVSNSYSSSFLQQRIKFNLQSQRCID